VYVHLAPLAEKEVPVVALYKGAPMAGFSVKEIKTDTHTVTVSAAQNILDKIQQVKAEIILNGSEDTNISQTVQLAVAELSDVPKESIHINPSELSVTAIIVPQLQQKTVMIKPDITGNGVTDELTKMVEISPAQAAIQGEAGDLASIEFVQTIPLELTLLQRMDAPFEIGLTLPEGVTLVNPQEVIKVMLKKADATPGVTEESAP
jgi:YbbR domain-containing protein